MSCGFFGSVREGRRGGGVCLWWVGRLKGLGVADGLPLIWCGAWHVVVLGDGMVYGSIPELQTPGTKTKYDSRLAFPDAERN